MCSRAGNKCLILLLENFYLNILVYYKESTLGVESPQFVTVAILC